MPERPVLPDEYYDLTLRLWSNHTPLEPTAMRLGLHITDLDVLGQSYETRGRKRVARRHFACVASMQVLTAHDAEVWLGATLGQMARTGTQFGPDIEALFWMAQFGRIRQESLIPNPILVARAVALGARIFIENYTPQSADGINYDDDADTPLKTWYPPD